MNAMVHRLASSIIVLFAATSTLALADATPSAAPSAPAHTDAPARNGGTIEGRVSAVDFSHGTLEIDSTSRGKVTVLVPPSTPVESKDAGYHSVTDLTRGTQVQVLTSERGGKLSAQLIRIK